MNVHAIAQLLSTLGHPLLTMSLFVLFATTRSSERSPAGSLILIGVVILPITVWNWRKSRRGEYTNFDVSERRQRPSMYAVLIGLMAAASGVMWATGHHPRFVAGMLCALMLLTISFALNFVIKSSLHAAFSFYLSVLLFTIDLVAGLAMSGLAVLIGWSRVVLGHHTSGEVLIGSLLGLSCALVFRFAA